MKFEGTPQPNPEENSESQEKETGIEISVTREKASVLYHDLELNGENPTSPEVEIVVEKQPIELVEGESYSNRAVLLDRETEKMQSLASKAEALLDLPEHERIAEVLDILKSEVRYAFNDVLEKVAETDPDLAKWVAENTGLNVSSVHNVPLSEIVEKGYGVCRHLAPAYLWLAQKAGLKGVILSSDTDLSVIKNIKRSDTKEKLFKSVEVGQDVAAHSWVEIKTSDGRWIPVDPSTGLVGASEEGLAMFKEANYMAYGNLGFDVEAKPGDKLRTKGTPVLFGPAEATASGKYCVELRGLKSEIRIGKENWPPTNIPYLGEGILNIATNERSGGFYLDIIEIKEVV